MIYSVIDIETTGLNIEEDAIIEIGAVRIDEKGKQSEFSSLIRTDRLIPSAITEITGIDDSMLENAPGLDQVIPDFLEFIAGTVPVAHNAQFDGAFLYPHTGIPVEDWLDTIVLAKMVWPSLESYSLQNLIQHFNIVTDNRHRGLDDAKAEAKVLSEVIRSLKESDPGLNAARLHLTEVCYPLYYRFLQQFDCDYFSEKSHPYEDKNVFYNKEKTGEEMEFIPVSYEKIDSAFCSPDGMASCMERFSYRKPQADLAHAVADAFNSGDFLVAEAGTGTGKTLSYLLPASVVSKENHIPVVISTHTVHLQEQIVKKDLPELNKYYKNQLKFSLLKGRGHYLCRRKWEEDYKNPNKENALFLLRLLTWVTGFDTNCPFDSGDMDPLNFNRFDRKKSAEYCASFENCYGPRCRFYHSRCFVHKARKSAEQSDLIVINHSLLLSDSNGEGSILPKYDYLIIDEAHQLEMVAEDAYGKSFTYSDYQSALSDYNDVRRDLENNFKVGGLYFSDSSSEKIQKKAESLYALKDSFSSLSNSVKEFFEQLLTCVDLSDSGKSAQRLDSGFLASEGWDNILSYGENLIVLFRQVIHDYKTVSSNFEDYFQEDGKERQKRGFENAYSKICEFASIVDDFLAVDDHSVMWIEKPYGSGKYPSIQITPLEINQLLHDNLYMYLKSIIFLSATLSVNHKFDFFKKTIGLDLLDNRVKDIMIPSVFDYDHNMRLLVASDIPLPGEVSLDEYIDVLSEVIRKMVSASKGNALVLFTSHSQLKYVYKKIHEPLESEGITVLGHEISGSRSYLLESMRKNPDTVLLGANSFWEGIDIAGNHLRLLIIVRLPFWPPDLPVIAAKMEKLSSENRNPFNELNLPQAVIRFKQGFGRLIRSENDKGIVVVLDKRLQTKRYGKNFVASLPVDRCYCSDTDSIVSFIGNNLK